MAHTIACGLAAQGHMLRVVSNRYPRILPRRECVDGITVERRLFLWPDGDYWRHGRLDLLLASLYFGPATLAALVWRVMRFRPDVVNVHFAGSQVPFILRLHAAFSFRLVVSLHGDDVASRLPEELGQVNGHKGNEVSDLRLLLHRADAVTACSGYLLEQACRLHPAVGEKGVVIHNGIAPERFRAVMPYHHPRPYVLAYGRLTYKKGFDMLLAAFTGLVANNAGYDLLLAGEGEERPALEQAIHEQDLVGRVHLLGRVAPVEIVRLLRGASLAVVPSRREPFGIAALEALAAGTPLVATAVGGLVEFVDTDHDDFVWLAPPTVNGLGETIGRALKRVEERAQPPHRPREAILRRHGWAQVIDRYEQVLAGRTQMNRLGNETE